MEAEHRKEQMIRRHASNRSQREHRVREKLKRGSRPRLSIFRSAKKLYGQIIDDAKGTTLAAASEQDLSAADRKLPKKERAHKLGELVASRSLKHKVRKVVFDRSYYRYHGRVKAFAEGARQGGLDF